MFFWWSTNGVIRLLSFGLSGRRPPMLVRHLSNYVKLMRSTEETKEDDRKCRELLPNAQFLVFGGECGSEPLVTRQAVYGREQLELAISSYDGRLRDEGLLSEYGLEPSIVEFGSVFLNLQLGSGAPRFAVAISDGSRRPASTEFCKPRVAAFILRAEEANLVSHAACKLAWHRTFKYCPSCGQQTIRNVAGTQRQCMSCQKVYFPQLSAVAITLLTSPKEDQCLLVRQPRYVKGMYSAIAGYVEPGETLEEAVKREVAEEVGLDVLAQRYLTSQHWSIPPGTFMLGSIASVDPDQNISLDGKELEAARWFDLAEVQEAVRRIQVDPYLRIRSDSHAIFVPPKGAIAYDLIQHFLEKSTR